MDRMSPILYQNEARDITLIDIPLSISAAQGISDTLLSSTPITEPFISNDPKSDAAKVRLGQNTIDENIHSIYKSVIGNALARIKENISGDWCLPRKIMVESSSKSRKKDLNITNSKVSEANLDQHLKTLQEESSKDISVLMSSLHFSFDTANPNGAWTVSYEKPRDISEELETIQEPWAWAFHNSYNQSLNLTVSKPVNGSLSALVLNFKIPSHSTFYLQDCTTPTPFRTAFRSITEDHRLPRHFNFVLLDPPWPNRSAKRKAAYTTSFNASDLKRLILKMDIDLYIEHDALVGIWITNKPALRDLVLGPNGLFKRLNVGLVEEWIWIKTTTRGEPISSMDSTWRKPYEVLLLGKAAGTSYAVAEPAEEVKRRVIAGVPDLHSRKPCLKELIKPFMPDPEDYSALEIFPRHLVAGWSSWGDQVLKFNWEGYWASSATHEPNVDVDVDMEMQ